MNYLIDSSSLIEIENTSATHKNNIDIFIPTIVRAEILEGVYTLNNQKIIQRTKQFLLRFTTLDFDSETAEILARLRANNTQNGTKKPLADSIILATAIQHNIDALITENKKDFQNKLFTGKVISLKEL